MGLKLPSKSTISHAVSKVKEEVKAHPMVAAAVGGVPAIVAVGAYEHRGEIKSTLSHIGAEVKKDAGIVKKDTIAIAKEVGHDVKKVGSSAVSGFKNLYFYGMLALGGIILVKFL